MMTELLWRDPPDRRRRVLTDDVVAALRTNPGRWAVIRRYPNRTAINGFRPKHPADIEVRGVAEPPGSVFYARAKHNDNNKEEEHP